MAPGPAGAPTSAMLVDGYRRGDFPEVDPASGELVWTSPDPRAVLPLDGLDVSRRLAKLLRSARFEISSDRAFEAVVRACAEPGPERQELWLDERLIQANLRLHEEGLAHSVEAWHGGRLAGGLYGVALGGAFFGESMFHRDEAGGRDASKVCLVRLVEWLRAGGFELLDVQYPTPHLERLGAVEIPRAVYLGRLERALATAARWPPLAQAICSRSILRTK